MLLCMDTIFDIKLPEGEMQFDDTYTGVRYRYGSDIHAFDTLFWRWIIGSGRDNWQYGFGTMDSIAPIPESLVKAWELELIATIAAKEDDETVQAYRFRCMKPGA
jgi:maltoporin